VHVILGAAYDKSLESVLARDAAEEGPQIVLNLGCNEIAAVLG
jgi:hypothetical protein